MYSRDFSSSTRSLDLNLLMSPALSDQEAPTAILLLPSKSATSQLFTP